MNKKFAAFFTANGMTVSGNSAYGYIQGYETNGIVNVTDNVSPLKLHVSFYATDDQKRAIASTLRNAALKHFKFNFTPYGLLIGLNDITVGKLLNRLPSIMQLVFLTISQNGGLGQGYCPVCGNPFNFADDDKHVIDGVTVTLDDDCLNNINTVIEAENKDFNEAPNNYLSGFFGALLGGVVGGLLSILIYLIGFISSISAIVSVLLGAFLYQKFHGKPNKMMIVIVTCTTLVCMIASVFGIYIVAAGISASEAGLTISAFEAFALLMDDAEFARYFYIDLGMILLFSAMGIFAEIISLSKKVKRQQTIR